MGELTLHNGLRLGVLSFLFLLCVYLYIHRRCQRKALTLFGEQHGCQPIQKRLPCSWPLGLDILKYQYDALMRGELLAYQAERFGYFQVGNTFEIRILGQVGYFTTDPKNLEAMLQTRFDGLGNSRNALLPMIGNGIFTQDGYDWKRSRDILRRQFARIRYDDMKLFDAPGEKLIESLQRSTGVVDLQPAFFRFTLATTVSLSFGELSAGLATSEHDKFAEAFDYTSLISAMRMRLADLCWVYNPPRYRKACKLVSQYAAHYVEGAIADIEKDGEEVAAKRHPSITDLLQEMKDPQLVHSQLINVLITGRDTTACLMSWACYQLVRNPASLQRLRQEIASFVGNGETPTRAQINQMTYLRYVLKETNRLYTQIPVNLRLALRMTYLPRGGGPDGESPILIPKGTGVGFSAYHMHRSKEIYGENANEFCPERWDDPQLKNLGFAFMPFHGGPRVCLGKDFALMEASYGLVRLLQAFPNLKIAPGTLQTTPGLEKQSLTIVVSSAEGCKVLLH
ncbi:cytochrome P450 [Aspergillus heterothallicus]